MYADSAELACDCYHAHAQNLPAAVNSEIMNVMRLVADTVRRQTAIFRHGVF